MTAPSYPDSSPSGSSMLNTGFVPLGERALQSILDHVVAVGDEAETTYLEVKSELVMSAKATVAKIAKFLLGTANRRPREAAQHFQGYAVLVIGAEKNNALGVPRGTEAHELEDRLSAYLGPQFPAFEFGRIAVNSEREVLFVIGQPPQEGQTIFPCHKDYQGDNRRDSLDDGAIYVRGTSNTRTARSGEVLALVERAREGGTLPIELMVQLIGQIHRVIGVEEVLERVHTYREEQFAKESTPNDKNGLVSTPFPLDTGIFGSQKPLSAEGRKRALAAWQGRKDEHLAEGREHLLGVGLSGAGIRVVSRDRFVAKPHLIITFHDCELIEHLDPDEADLDKVVEPVLKKQPPYWSGMSPSPLSFTSRDYPVDWSNGDKDAEIVLTPDSFRPNAPWTSEQDDYVIVMRDSEANSVEVSWVLTEEGNNTVTTGQFRVLNKHCINALEMFKSTFITAVQQ